MPKQKTASDFYWYHCVDLGNGQITDGDYAMAQYLPHYHFPDDMTGMKVLDVGRASGYFAFEFEDRGADVTATELRSINDWDFVGGEEGRKASMAKYLEHPDFEDYFIKGAFNYAHSVRKSKVKKVAASVYDLSPALFGGQKFDLVFAGSITSHLKSPIVALEKLFSVTADTGTCIVSAPFLDVVEMRELPFMAMVGRSDPDLRSWWVLNAKGLSELLYAAGFKVVRVLSHFNLEHLKEPSVFPHIVAHAMK
ncbi:class I SAM-dependent methyltransferase [Variovorax ginsengisoli]|uniref:Methyltransferase domain-containing protein n=1 Tax=Variovorax ginsengisoli TaxID=363844 RepID=A0ABT8SB94_9BURK|nr:methyltransferase domain-containing protein [Variovorax ginsengisoli]MDN8617019.1 methyltransferase domain-containing protein [Variovorax ginsengisoli]MDO1536189.1 methyltransferase domain-containing protein [Variovorax ginsengisoli]